MSRETTNQKTADYIQHDRRTDFIMIDRRGEIARLRRRLDFSLMVWVVSTVFVFGYLGVFNFELYSNPYNALPVALLGALIPATLGGFYYFNERRTHIPKIRRLMKYERLFQDFIEAMYRDMERNDAEKGDSWLTLAEAELEAMSDRKYSSDSTPERLVKLSNYCAMIYLRSQYEPSHLRSLTG